MIVRSIAEIARTLHKKTVAEFVGDQATLEMVERLGIDYVQGFHVGMPGPSVALAGPRRAVGWTEGGAEWLPDEMTKLGFPAFQKSAATRRLLSN